MGGEWSKDLISQIFRGHMSLAKSFRQTKVGLGGATGRSYTPRSERVVITCWKGPITGGLVQR